MSWRLLWRRIETKYGSRWIPGMVLTLLAVAQALGILPTTLVQRADDFLYDIRMRLQHPVLDSRIVIVNIDEKSLTEIGRWPWSRDVIATLVTKLNDQYRPKAIGFDVVFAEPDNSSGYTTLQSLAKNELKGFPTFGKSVLALKPMLDFDGRLAKALRGRPVVLGYFLSHKAEGPTKGLLPPPAFTMADLDDRRLDAVSWDAYSANLPQLQQAAAGGGFFNSLPDPDGVIRRMPLLAQFGNAYYESLALATARVALGATAIRPSFLHSDGINSEESLREYGAIEAIRLNTNPRTRIPVEPFLTVLIPFRGYGGPLGGSFRYVSAVDIIKDRLPDLGLKNKIFLIGTTVAGLKDLRTAPVGVGYPGVEMHANVIASILDDNFKRRPDISIAFEVVQATLVGILLIIILPILSPGFSILFALGMGVSVGLLNLWMYQSFNLVLPVATTLLLILSLFMIDVAWGYLFEYRKGRAMVNLFGEYVAPELVAEMADNPGSYNMEGDSRELTVLFADVRGFTSISEQLEPNALREYINRYLTAMSENIRGNRGTLDKYIGDAVMAFWGAPITLPNHASLAVETALTMQSIAQTLNRDFIERGWPTLRIGIGLNTGQMRVGDMGSKIRRAYTVMGDAVNLSSRLEGLTKTYGAGIIVGEATKLAAPEFIYRELDRVRVRGKQQPVPIFEPLGLPSQVDDNMRAAIVRWDRALEWVRLKNWDAAESAVRALHEAYPDDGLYKLYLERLAYYRTHPPESDWDGVTTFDTK